MQVVPVGEERQFTSDRPSSERHQNETGAFALQGFDEPLDQGDASLFAHGAEARLNAFPLTPALETLAPELLSFVADQILRLHPPLLNGAIQ